MCPTNSLRTRHSQSLWATHGAASANVAVLELPCGPESSAPNRPPTGPTINACCRHCARSCPTATTESSRSLLRLSIGLNSSSGPAGPAREGQERSHWSVARRASIAGGIHPEQIPARPDAVKDVASRINSGVPASSLGSRRTISGAMRSSAESRGLFTDRPVWASSRRSRMWTSEVRIGRTF
jgi:hypothetical protein